MRIAILGYSGSGKSTLAKYLSEWYGIPALYLDTVKFTAGWKERDREEAMAMVSAFMEGQNWVIDGNYTSFHQRRRLEEADRIVFMNFNRWNCLIRAIRRYRRYKGKARESMAAGCDEKLDLSFIWWILWQGRTRRRKKKYAAILRDYGEKTVVLHNQRELNRFMESPFSDGRPCQNTAHGG